MNAVKTCHNFVSNRHTAADKDGKCKIICGTCDQQFDDYTSFWKHFRVPDFTAAQAEPSPLW